MGGELMGLWMRKLNSVFEVGVTEIVKDSLMNLFFKNLFRTSCRMCAEMTMKRRVTASKTACFNCMRINI